MGNSYSNSLPTARRIPHPNPLALELTWSAIGTRTPGKPANGVLRIAVGSITANTHPGAHE